MRWCAGISARTQRAGVCNGHTKVYGAARRQFWVGCCGFGEKTRNILNSCFRNGHMRFGRCEDGYHGRCHTHGGGSATWGADADDGGGYHHFLEAGLQASFAYLQKGIVFEMYMENENIHCKPSASFLQCRVKLPNFLSCYITNLLSDNQKTFEGQTERNSRRVLKKPKKKELEKSIGFTFFSDVRYLVLKLVVRAEIN